MALELEDLLPILASIAASREDRRSLAELAREAGSSPSTFQRAFSRLVGESPKQYTLRLQLECAALMLVGTDRSVLEVALECGFDSHEGFTRAFSRQLGLAPREFRRRYAHLADQDRHLELMSQVGPCIGLFRAPLASTHRSKDDTMNYDITRQPIAETTFLYQEARCSHAQIAETLGQLLPAVFGHAMKHGLELRSPPMTLYLDWGPGMVTLRAGLAVAPGSDGGDFGLETLPACQAAVTVHTGPYEGLPDAHAAVEQFLAEEKLSAAGAPREIYLTDPGEVPDPKDWKTQIIWPVAP